MFTGIIQEVGTIAEILESETGKTFTVKASKILHNKKIGDSIAINGACMTITTLSDTQFTFDCIHESLKKTNLNQLHQESKINMEGSLTLDKGIDGHLVQGHVDFTAPIKTLEIKENGDTTLTISLPSEYQKFIALKGSITINGVSLTISHLESDSFQVSLIPHTLAETNLSDLETGSIVNIEIDLISRYLDRLLQDKAQESTYQFLRERNLI